MPPLVYESRFCQFEVPWNWNLVSGVGAYQDWRGVRRSAVLVEDWLTTPMSAASYAQGQKNLLEEQSVDLEVLEERNFDSKELGDVHWGAFAARSSSKAALRQELLTAINGPLVCCLALAAQENDQESWKDIFPEIYRSFVISARGWAREIRREPLCRPAGGSAGGQRVAVPEWQISFDLQPGWHLEEKAGRLRHDEGAELSVRRSGLSSDSPDALFAEALARAHRNRSRAIKAWDHGETDQGWTFFALESSETTTKTWGPEEVWIFREVFFLAESAAVAALRARQGDVAAAAMLSSLVSESSSLPPEQREIKIEEPWLGTRLSGPWMSAAPGIYVYEGEPATTLMVQRFDQSSDLDRLRLTAPEGLKRQFQITRSTDEKIVAGTWKRSDALRWSVEYADGEGKAHHLRAAWIAAPRATYELVVVSNAASSADKTLLQVLQDLNEAAMAQSL